jgi:hypothetical protein
MACGVGVALVITACSSSVSIEDADGSRNARLGPPEDAEALTPAMAQQVALRRAEAVRLEPPRAVRSMNEVRLQAALRMVAAHPTGSYTSKSPDPLLAIPVLEIELNGDGSVRRISVLRAPRQARDTTQIAIDAVRQAAPYGDVSRLPRPWRFTETFLFDDDRRWKPRTLD